MLVVVVVVVVVLLIRIVLRRSKCRTRLLLVRCVLCSTLLANLAIITLTQFNKTLRV